ncbi:MAG: hypothetical protein ABNH38_05375 [Tateyamaria sp.]|uniref:hypothetical protein n=1 Tax=Tateyamaria sp. TaxID=1929288 RepID=UPI0032DC3239
MPDTPVAGLTCLQNVSTKPLLYMGISTTVLIGVSLDTLSVLAAPFLLVFAGASPIAEQVLNSFLLFAAGSIITKEYDSHPY